MEKKRIKCPKCSSVLDISFKQTGESVKHITCPVCKTRLKVNLATPAPAQEPKKPEPENDDNRTIILKDPPPREATFRIVFNGMPFELRDGQNTIGRKANSSTALIKIPTTDMTTSRSHMVIEVIKGINGIKYATLANHKNSNPTKVNGVEIAKGDVIKLNDGDQISMGETTTVVFEVK